MNALKLLSRNEMKMIKGGIDECNETNCLNCATGTFCTVFNEQEPPQDCSWGFCGQCCSDVGEG